MNLIQILWLIKWLVESTESENVGYLSLPLKTTHTQGLVSGWNIFKKFNY